MRCSHALLALTVWLPACGSSASQPPSDAGIPDTGFVDQDGNVDGQGCIRKTCEQLGAACGVIDDGCGKLLPCGTCHDPDSCGGAGVANQCGCTPRTCEDVGANCGVLEDGCADTIACGTCSAPDTCGGGNASNVCAHPLCDDGWCVLNPHPHANDFYGAFAQTGMSFAVGASGTALRRTTGGWSLVPSFTRVLSDLRDFVPIGASDGWAIGNIGAILRFDGDRLMCVDLDGEVWSPTETDLFAIVQDQQDAIWIVGEGTILRLDAQGWTVDRRFDGVLHDAAAMPDGSVVAVGARERAGGVVPVVMRHDGTWVDEDIGEVDGELHGVASTDEGAVIAVGARSNGQPWVAQRTGWQWSDIPLPGASGDARRLRSVAAVGSEVWAVGDKGVLVRVHGSRAELVAPLFGDGDLKAVLSAGQGLLLVGEDGLVAEYHHGFWHPSLGRVPPLSEGEAVAECARRGHDVWLGGPGWVMRWNGLRWTYAHVPVNVVGLYAVSPQAVWVVGNRGVEDRPPNGVVMHYDGYAWTEAYVAPGQSFTAVQGTSSTDVRARMQDGQWVRFDGAAWELRSAEELPVPGTTGCSAERAWSVEPARGFVHKQGDVESATRVWPFGALQESPHDAWAASESEVWATGADGVVHGTQQGWRKELEGIEVRAVRGSSPQDVWLVGSGSSADGPVWHWDGESLQAVTPAPDESELFAVSSTPEGPVVCAGERVHFWQGASWRAEMIPGSGPIRSIWAWSETDVWAARGTALLHYDGEQWAVIDPFEKLDRPPMSDATTMEVQRIFGITPEEMLYMGRTPDQGAAILLVRSHGQWGNGVLQGVGWDATFTSVWARGLDDAWVTMGQVGWVYHYRHSVRMFDDVEAATADPLQALAGYAEHRWAFGEGGVIVHAAP